LFDVSDTGLPVVVDQYTWDHWSQTEAAADHHAFGYFAEHDALAIPVGNWHGEWVDDDGDGFHDRWVSNRQDDLYVFQLGVAPSGLVDPKIQLLGKVTHDWQVRRSGYIADRLYSVSTDDIIVSDIADPSVPIATLVFGATMDDVEPPLPLPESFAERTATPLDDAPLRNPVRTATAHMAERLQIEPGRIALVTAEAGRPIDPLHGTGSESASAYELVLQAEGARYLYHAEQVGQIELVSTDFDFVANVAPRHNAANPLDVDDDGQISSLDALLVINVLNDMADSGRTAPLRAVDVLVQQSSSQYYVDIDGDGSVTRIDAIDVVNYLNASELLTGMFESMATSFAAARQAAHFASVRQAARRATTAASQDHETLSSDARPPTERRRPFEWLSSARAAARTELRQQDRADEQDSLCVGLRDRLFAELGRSQPQAVRPGLR
jgi:hypothetical protein